MQRSGHDLDVDPARIWPAAVSFSAAALLAILLLLIPGVRASVVATDNAWHDLLVPVRNSVAVGFATFMYWAGDVAITALVRVALGAVLLFQRRWYTFWAWTVAGIVSPVCVEVLKVTAERSRPLDIILWADGHSFPSGHAAAAATTSIMIVLAFVPAARRTPAWIAAAGWTLLMAWSRNLLAAHWLSDVVVGMLVGAAVPLAVFAAAATLQQSRRPEVLEELDRPEPSRTPE